MRLVSDNTDPIKLVRWRDIAARGTGWQLGWAQKFDLRPIKRAAICPHCGQGEVVNWYSLQEVIDIEKQPAFAAAIEAKRREPEIKAQQEKRKREREEQERKALIEEARALPIAVKRLSKDVLIATAKEHYNAGIRDGRPKLTKTTTGYFVRCVQVDFIADQLMSFDEKRLHELNIDYMNVVFRAGQAALSNLVYARIYREIGAQYPHLAAECARAAEQALHHDFEHGEPWPFPNWEQEDD